MFNAIGNDTNIIMYIVRDSIRDKSYNFLYLDGE
jgi:hypothetical protein